MRKTTLTIMAAMALVFTFSGCAQKQKISEQEFVFVWEKYLGEEFEESLDQKQSSAQKEVILQNVLKEYKIDTLSFVTYMKLKHEDKYKRIFTTAE